MAGLIALLAGLTVLVLIVGLANLQAGNKALKARLSLYAVPARTLEEYELSQPFQERIVAPIVQGAARFVIGLTPPKTVEDIRRRLVLAGNPYGMDVRDFLGVKGLLALTLGSLVFLSFIRTGMVLHALLFGGLLGALGFYTPNIWLGARISRRKKEITRSLPDALDLLTVCVEAGLGFDSAILKLTQKWDNALSREFSRVLSETRMGKSRREALRNLVNRTDVSDVNTFVSAIIQADQLGVSISNVLRIQSEQMRLKRRQRAEELAHQAAIKMIFPMIFLMFPSIYVIVLGPAIPQIMKGFGGH
ncbi:MAG: type II secretion system F family protein [Chloroflexi bacterium]|nr:type II secretion system F family protein [Chloroflexota bacterium]